MDNRNNKIAETSLYEIWKKQQYNLPLKTLDGEDIDVVDAGIFNDSTAGPDFKNARIRIGNFTFVGDIEIDSDYSDWKTHGHHIDNKYSKVILHASFYNRNKQAYVYTREGRKIHSICLDEFIDKNNFIKLSSDGEKVKEQQTSNIKCSFSINIIPVEDREKYLYKLGLQRFEKKCKKIFNRVKELQFLSELHIKEPVISYDLSRQFQEKKFRHSDFNSKSIWQQLLYELTFEALGYSKNKTQMMSLARHANIDFLNKIENDGVLNEKYEAVLFYISGLAHDVNSVNEELTKKYIEKLSINWNSVRSFYDGKFLDETDWHFFRLRPQNFPTIRIAGGAKILKEIVHKNLIGVIAKKITEIHNPNVLINILRSLFVLKAEGYWKNHYVFDQTANSEIKYLVGASRADEIVVNVVLPFFSVYFEIFGNSKVSKKIFTVYSAYEQKSENQITLDVAKSLDLSTHMKKTIFSQGMIELFRNYCSKNKCLECEIGKVVFN